MKRYFCMQFVIACFMDASGGARSFWSDQRAEKVAHTHGKSARLAHRGLNA